MKRNMDQLYHDLCRSYTVFHTGVFSAFNKNDVSYHPADQRIVIRKRKVKHGRNQFASYYPQIVIQPDMIVKGNYRVEIGWQQWGRSLAYWLSISSFFVFILWKSSGVGLCIGIALALSFVILHATYLRSFFILLHRLREEVNKG